MTSNQDKQYLIFTTIWLYDMIASENVLLKRLNVRPLINTFCVHQAQDPPAITVFYFIFILFIENLYLLFYFRRCTVFVRLTSTNGDIIIYLWILKNSGIKQSNGSEHAS